MIVDESFLLLGEDLISPRSPRSGRDTEEALPDASDVATMLWGSRLPVVAIRPQK